MVGSKVEFPLSLTLSHRERELLSALVFSLSLWERAGERGRTSHNTFMVFY